MTRTYARGPAAPARSLSPEDRFRTSTGVYGCQHMSTCADWDLANRPAYKRFAVERTTGINPHSELGKAADLVRTSVEPSHRDTRRAALRDRLMLHVECKREAVSRLARSAVRAGGRPISVGVVVLATSTQRHQRVEIA